MTRHLLMVAICIAVLLTQCSIDYRLDRKEEKIIGAWAIEKVYYKRDNALFRDNITHRYRDDIIEFYPSYLATYEDYSEGLIFDGDWEIFAEGYDGDFDFFIEATFYDFILGDVFYLSGHIDRLNNNKLHFEGSDALGTYTFKLRRL